MATEVTISGGDKMQEKLSGILATMGGSLSVGFMENATYEDGTPVAAVAFWNEFGHGGQFPAPPRPFFRPMVADESPKIGRRLAAQLKTNGMNGKKALEAIGADLVTALQTSITKVQSPPLSPTTLRLRKIFGNRPELISKKAVLIAQHDVAEGKALAGGTQAKPLIWTGHMKENITFKVD